MAELPPLRDVIAAHGLLAKKSLGQNFLLDANLLDKIVRLSGVQQGDTVYEVGPGPGGLTRALLRAGAQVAAIERDDRAIAALAELKQHFPGQLVIVHGDAMAADEPALLGKSAHVVANLPYNVGTALLLRWLTLEPWPPWWLSLTLMFQKEVAERIIAAPGSDAYGRLAVLAASRANAKIIMTVPRAAFTPPPKVTSAVVLLKPLQSPAPVQLATLERVTAAAFGQRRKMLRSALRAICSEPEKLLYAAAINGERRAETLSLDEFVALSNALDRIQAA